MFSKEKKSNSFEKNSLASATLISEGTTFTGDIKSEADLRVDGSIIGNILSTSKVIVGPSGYVEGNIEGQQADINGKVKGNILVKDLLQLKGQCLVQGNIASAKLQIDPTATFNGQCQMGTLPANVVKMAEPDAAKAKAK